MRLTNSLSETSSISSVGGHEAILDLAGNRRDDPVQSPAIRSDLKAINFVRTPPSHDRIPRLINFCRVQHPPV